MSEPETSATTDAKVVITGTGRAGTTLLVQVLTDLGLDTGYTSEAQADARVHGGLEKDILAPDAPWIVKAPALSGQLGELIASGTVAVEHVIVPIRELDVAAASRVRSARYGANLRTPGGLIATPNATRQKSALAILEYELFYAVARFEIPLTLLHFPRFAQDWEYTYRHLSFLDPSLPAGAWRDALTGRFEASWLHQQPLSRREQGLTVLGTVYNRGIAAPARAARRLLTGDSARSQPRSGSATDGDRGAQHP